ncbi:MAG TPA: hypothetical protein P5232_02555 [Candidatus Moranbacteria bacterium]|nr:hypothetical protein [Candidatus Moranbacteria bacterium]
MKKITTVLSTILMLTLSVPAFAGDHNRHRGDHALETVVILTGAWVACETVNQLLKDSSSEVKVYHYEVREPSHAYRHHERESDTYEDAYDERMRRMEKEERQMREFNDQQRGNRDAERDFYSR